MTVLSGTSASPRFHSARSFLGSETLIYNRTPYQILIFIIFFVITIGVSGAWWSETSPMCFIILHYSVLHFSDQIQSRNLLRDSWKIRVIYGTYWNKSSCPCPGSAKPSPFYYQFGHCLYLANRFDENPETNCLTVIGKKKWDTLFWHSLFEPLVTEVISLCPFHGLLCKTNADTISSERFGLALFRKKLCLQGFRFSFLFFAQNLDCFCLLVPSQRPQSIFGPKIRNVPLIFTWKMLFIEPWKIA